MVFNILYYVEIVDLSLLFKMSQLNPMDHSRRKLVILLGKYS